MRINSFILLLFLALVVYSGCNSGSGNKATISGEFGNLPNTTLFIYQVLPSSKPLIDSVSTDSKGIYTITFEVPKTGFYTIKRNNSDEITLIISPGENITLNADGNALRSTYKVKGSQESELYAEFNRFTNVNLVKVDSLSRVFAESRTNPDFQSVKNRLDSSYMQVFNDQKQKVNVFVSSHLSSLASLLAISENFGPNQVLSEKTHPELFIKLDSALIQAYPENSLVNTFHQHMLTFKAEIADLRAQDSLLKPGMPAPEIILNDSRGNENKLSEIKNRVKLVYFWSSWNAECRQMNGKLSNLFSQYYTQGFVIYAVSVDSDPELWQNACSIDRINSWIQLIDPKGLASEYSRKYGVRAIPNMILVGKDGKIIARNPDFSDLNDLIRKNI